MIKAFLRDCLATFQAIFAHRSIALTLVFAVPFYSFFYPAAYQGQVAQSVPIVVVDEENSALSRQIVRAVSATPNVSVYAVDPNFLYAQDLANDGKVEGILYLPATLSQSVHRGEEGGVGLYLSGAYFLRAQQVGLGLKNALEETIRESLAPFLHISHKDPPTLVRAYPLFNSSGGYGSYIVPAVAPLIVHQTLLIGVSMLAMTLRAQYRRFSPSQYLAIFCSASLIGCLSCWYFFGFVFWWQDYPRGGNLWAMLFATPVFVGCVVGLALLVASFLDCIERVGAVFVCSSVPLFLLTGLSFPLYAMPAAVEALAYALPSTHGVQTFAQLNQMGAPLSAVAGKLWYLAAFGSVCFVWAYARLKNPIQTQAAPKAVNQKSCRD